MEIIDLVVCPVDLSPASANALHHAAAWARWYGVPMRVLHVVMPPQSLAEGVGQSLGFPAHPHAEARAAVERFVSAALPDDRWPNGAQPAIDLLEGQDVKVILEEARNRPRALFVMGTHGSGALGRVLFGSVTERVSRAIVNPLLVVPPHETLGPIETRRIVCAVDFRPSSLAALRFALSLARQGQQQLQLVTVIDQPWADEVRSLDEQRREQATMREALLERVPDTVREACRVSQQVLRGAPAQALLTYAAEGKADLIVMGTGEHGYLHDLWFGSTTAKVIRSTACPVLVVPTPHPPSFAEAKPVDRREWNSELARLSLAYRGQPATIAIVRDDLGTQREATAMPFLGVIADLRKGADEIAVMLARPGGAHLTHVVPHPREVRLREPDADHDLELIIVSNDGSTTLLDVGVHSAV